MTLLTKLTGKKAGTERNRTVGWCIASNNDQGILEELLLKNEWRCAAFSARLKEYPLYKAKDVILVNRASGSISEAILLTSGGNILPVLTYGTTISGGLPEEDRDFLINIFENIAPIYSIIGISRDVKAIEQLLPGKARRRVDYDLMVLRKEDLTEKKYHHFHNLIIRKATAGDAKALLPLQEQYELEEVYLNKWKFNRKTCLQGLKLSLEKELIYLAEIEGSPVAKAATNARGFKVAQIGGVFTKREHRNTGLGYLVMKSLLLDLFKSQTMATLFVKKENSQAIQLYVNLGFKKIDHFRISYYNI